MSVFTTERGRVSAARVFLLGPLVVVLWLALTGAHRDEIVWTTLQTLALALIAWAAGPRVAQYFPGILSGLFSGLRRPSADAAAEADTGITPEGGT